MSKVIIYSKANCGYCDMAKSLFNSQQIPFEEIRVDLDPIKLEEMIQKSNRRTMPQIFINNHHVGGYDDLVKTMQAGELDKLLNK